MTTNSGPFNLSGRAALVTGASSGLGRHFALTLAQAGAKVAVAARRTGSLEEVRAAIAEGGWRCRRGGTGCHGQRLRPARGRRGGGCLGWAGYPDQQRGRLGERVVPR